MLRNSDNRSIFTSFQPLWRSAGL